MGMTLVTCQEAARITGHCREDISRWAARGRVRSEKQPGRWGRRTVCLEDVQVIPTRRRRKQAMGHVTEAERDQ